VFIGRGLLRAEQVIQLGSSRAGRSEKCPNNTQHQWQSVFRKVEEEASNQSSGTISRGVIHPSYEPSLSARVQSSAVTGFTLLHAGAATLPSQPTTLLIASLRSGYADFGAATTRSTPDKREIAAALVPV
jgi:hypothetical protein